MANLNFVESDKMYVAEFKISGPAVVHIERSVPTDMFFYQKCVEEGRYAVIKEQGYNGREVVENVISYDIYPVWIRVESASPVGLAVVISNEDVEVL